MDGVKISRRVSAPALKTPPVSARGSLARGSFYNQLFDAVDSNADGFISRHEFRTAVQGRIITVGPGEAERCMVLNQRRDSQIGPPPELASRSSVVTRRDSNIRRTESQVGVPDSTSRPSILHSAETQCAAPISRASFVSVAPSARNSCRQSLTPSVSMQVLPSETTATTPRESVKKPQSSAIPVIQGGLTPPMPLVPLPLTVPQLQTPPTTDTVRAIAVPSTPPPPVSPRQVQHRPGSHVALPPVLSVPISSMTPPGEQYRGLSPRPIFTAYVAASSGGTPQIGTPISPPPTNGSLTPPTHMFPISATTAASTPTLGTSTPTVATSVAFHAPVPAKPAITTAIVASPSTPRLSPRVDPMAGGKMVVAPPARAQSPLVPHNPCRIPRSASINGTWARVAATPPGSSTPRTPAVPHAGYAYPAAAQVPTATSFRTMRQPMMVVAPPAVQSQAAATPPVSARRSRCQLPPNRAMSSMNPQPPHQVQRMSSMPCAAPSPMMTGSQTPRHSMCQSEAGPCSAATPDHAPDLHVNGATSHMKQRRSSVQTAEKDALLSQDTNMAAAPPPLVTI